MTNIILQITTVLKTIKLYFLTNLHGRKIIETHTIKLFLYFVTSNNKYYKYIVICQK
ncbi:hypothetical protein ECH_1082 [Ehrlichia chaffeensis str. Arkansas]|uniref:Uncharacterized protein n=1 Tax=Ehrlichia chaffeensis (strain ATCC CRL-10679 / Arkansas) TaxID=205920 RepID=Q2GFB6_EHRCR|nr:hypothetical protein ECH_1082 [Ehrlichia chaffeensis str. Arkansas]